MRTLSRKILAAAVAGSAIVAGLAMPSQAATNATFELTGGALAVVEPASTVALGAVAAGDPLLTGSLGDVTVNDDRGVLTATWTATVSSTNFTTGTATAAETVTAANISYSSGAGLPVAGEVGTFTPSVGLALGTAQTAGSWTGTGVNHVTWNPSLVFTLATEQVAGIYSGTVTHSVA